MCYIITFNLIWHIFWWWDHSENMYFLTFSACFSIPIIFSNLNYNCSNLLDMRNLQEQVKKAFCYQELFRPFTVWINCSSDLKIFANSRLSAPKFKSFSRSLEQFFLTVGQNNFGNKIPFLRLPPLVSFFLNSLPKYAYLSTGDSPRITGM